MTSLEIHTLLSGDPENLQPFNLTQLSKLQTLETTSDTLAAEIYLLQAKKSILQTQRTNKIKILTRKAQAIALNEFKDASNLQETVNFALEFDDDDVFNEEFFQLQLQGTKFSVEQLLENALEKKRKFVENQSAKKSLSELNPDPTVIQQVQDTIGHELGQLNNGDVFTALVANSIEIPTQVGADQTMQKLLVEDVEMTQQMTKLHQALNQIRLNLAMAKNDVSIASQHAARSQLVLDQISIQIEQISAKNQKMSADKFEQFQCETQKKIVTYKRPWRVDSVGNYREQQLDRKARGLQNELKNVQFCVKMLQLSVNSVLNDSTFKLHFNFKGERLVRYLVQKTPFLQQVGMAIGVVGDDVNCDGVFMTE